MPGFTHRDSDLFGLRCSLYSAQYDLRYTELLFLSKEKLPQQDHIPVSQREPMSKWDFPKCQEYFLQKTGLAYHLSAKSRTLMV